MKKAKILLSTLLAVIMIVATFTSATVMSANNTQTYAASANTANAFNGNNEFTYYLAAPDCWAFYRFNIGVHFDAVGLNSVLSEGNEMDATFFLFKWQSTKDDTMGNDANRIAFQNFDNIVQGTDLVLELGKVCTPGEYLFVMYVPATGRSIAIRNDPSGTVGKGITWINNAEMTGWGDWRFFAKTPETATTYFYTPGTSVPSTCVDNDKNHYCDYGCGAKLSNCADTNPKDHACDVCGTTMGSSHTAAQGTHNCAYCNQPASQCTDTSPKDHVCDVCGGATGDSHVAASGSHACAYCGGTVSQCADTSPKDHQCDVCGTAMGDAHEAASGSHNCAYCGGTVSQCADTSPKDHQCDVCGTAMGGAHAAASGSHNCTYCGQPASECVDADPKDHECDVCGTAMGDAHAAASGSHNCAYCGGTFPSALIRPPRITYVTFAVELRATRTRRLRVLTLALTAAEPFPSALIRPPRITSVTPATLPSPSAATKITITSATPATLPSPSAATTITTASATFAARI